jgi:outer membrane protein OmpA-like peptidoglycan-associated protein
MRKKVIVVLSLLAIAACSMPPKPTVVDGKNRTPVNGAQSREQLERRARAHGNTPPAPMIAPKATPAAPPTKMVEKQTALQGGGDVLRFTFPFGATRLTLTDADKTNLLQKARAANRIEVRGRTDGTVPTPGDQKVARGRAYAMHAFLVTNGVDPARIVVSFASATDYRADNTTPRGRALNRRVEVEVSR